MGLWTMAGFCHRRQAIRQFRVDRIRKLAMTEQVFRRPVDFRTDEYFSDERLLARIKAGPLIEVQLQGAPFALAMLADHWYLRHCVVEQGVSTLWLRIDPRGFASLPEFLLPHGTAIDVISPDQLRLDLIRLAASWIEHHRAHSPKD
jgi:predicted DNA-binding transcriptional regulator YafY